jgi:hypothetical protein
VSTHSHMPTFSCTPVAVYHFSVSMPPPPQTDPAHVIPAGPDAVHTSDLRVLQYSMVGWSEAIKTGLEQVTALSITGCAATVVTDPTVPRGTYIQGQIIPEYTRLCVANSCTLQHLTVDFQRGDVTSLDIILQDVLRATLTAVRIHVACEAHAPMRACERSSTCHSLARCVPWTSTGVYVHIRLPPNKPAAFARTLRSFLAHNCCRWDSSTYCRLCTSHPHIREVILIHERCRV